MVLFIADGATNKRKKVRFPGGAFERLNTEGVFLAARGGNGRDLGDSQVIPVVACSTPQALWKSSSGSGLRSHST